MAELTALGPVLVHFFDFAQINSVRSIPYVHEWHRALRRDGLTVLGVHSPALPVHGRPARPWSPGSNGSDRPTPSPRTRPTRSGTTTAARGWPSLFLWSARRGARLVSLRRGRVPRRPRRRSRTSSAAGDALLELPRADGRPCGRPTRPGPWSPRPRDELFPGGGPAEPWRAAEGAERARDRLRGGRRLRRASTARAARLALDGDERVARRRPCPACTSSPSHPRHEPHRLRAAGRGGARPLLGGLRRRPAAAQSRCALGEARRTRGRTSTPNRPSAGISTRR